MLAMLAKRAARALIAILLLFAGAATAHAHAVLLTTTPNEGAVVQTAPDTFTLGFNEPVSVLAVSLITPQGEQIDVTQASTSGAEVTIDLPEALDQGTHVVSWRVVSVDGHPVGGATAFSIGVVTGAADAGADADFLVSSLLWLSKTVVYLAIFFGLGSAAFAAFGAPLPKQAAEIAQTMILVGVLAAPISLGLHGVDALGQPGIAFFSVQAWRTGLTTTYGPTVIVLSVALACAGVSLRMARSKLSIALAALPWIMAPIGMAMSGHAGAANPQWLTRPAVALHVAGIIFWVGALVPLMIMLGARDTSPQTGLARFSKFIPYPVAMILVSGFTLAVIQLGRDPALWFSPYGYILAAKLGLIVLLLGLAIWNRVSLTRPALAGDAGAQRHLEASIRVEVALVFVILALVAGWRFTPPPRALADAVSVPISFHIHTDAVMADATITPGRPGTNEVSLFLMDGEFGAVDPMDVQLAVSSPALGIEATTVSTTLGDDGFWHSDAVTLPLAGEWKMSVEIRLSRFEMVRLEHSFTLE